LSPGGFLNGVEGGDSDDGSNPPQQIPVQLKHEHRDKEKQFARFLNGSELPHIWEFNSVSAERADYENRQASRTDGFQVLDQIVSNTLQWDSPELNPMLVSKVRSVS
jgi:hypothetical protein